MSGHSGSWLICWLLQVKHKLQEARAKLKNLMSAGASCKSWATSELAGFPINAMPSTSTVTRAHCVDKQPEGGCSEQDGTRQVRVVGGRSSHGSCKPTVQRESKLHGNPHSQPCWRFTPDAAHSKPQSHSNKVFEAPGQHASQASSCLTLQDDSQHGLKRAPDSAVGEIAAESADVYEHKHV